MTKCRSPRPHLLQQFESGWLMPLLPTSPSLIRLAAAGLDRGLGEVPIVK